MVDDAAKRAAYERVRVTRRTVERLAEKLRQRRRDVAHALRLHARAGVALDADLRHDGLTRLYASVTDLDVVVFDLRVTELHVEVLFGLDASGADLNVDVVVFQLGTRRTSRARGDADRSEVAVDPLRVCRLGHQLFSS